MIDFASRFTPLYYLFCLNATLFTDFFLEKEINFMFTSIFRRFTIVHLKEFQRDSRLLPSVVDKKDDNPQSGSCFESTVL